MIPLVDESDFYGRIQVSVVVSVAFSVLFVLLRDAARKDALESP